jgi:hypothetical protein
MAPDCMNQMGTRRPQVTADRNVGRCQLDFAQYRPYLFTVRH